jgi:hypothetical protein
VLHLIADNFATHEHSAMARQTPVGSDELHPDQRLLFNVVERVSRNLTAEQLARGVFQNVAELIDTIERYITATPNRSSGPPATATSWPRSRGPAPSSRSCDVLTHCSDR